LKAGWGILSNTWWAFLKTRVSKPTLNPTQPPTKKKKIQHRMLSTFVAMDCAFRSLKMGEKKNKNKMVEMGW
jgi:hypothetical protein